TTREKMSLAKAIKKNEILKPFRKIPSKENGIDIEGLAVSGKWLYAGFRSPVLRGNLVPVLRFHFGEESDTEIFFVQLGGRGIRGLCATSSGFLILAGPPAEGPGSYQIYEWDGHDCLPGKDRPEKIGQCRPLGDLPKNEGKPEGVAVREEQSDYYDIL